MQRPTSTCRAARKPASRPRTPSADARVSATSRSASPTFIAGTSSTNLVPFARWSTQPRRGANQLREQPFARLGVLDEDRADRAVLRRFQNFLHSVPRGIGHLRLAVVIELEHLR